MGNSNSTNSSELPDRKNKSDSDSDIDIIFSDLKKNIEKDLKKAEDNIDGIFYKSQHKNKDNKNDDTFNTISLHFSDSPKGTNFNVNRTSKPKQRLYHKEISEVSETSEEIIEDMPSVISTTSDIESSRKPIFSATSSDQNTISATSSARVPRNRQIASETSDSENTISATSSARVPRNRQIASETSDSENTISATSSAPVPRQRQRQIDSETSSDSVSSVFINNSKKNRNNLKNNSDTLSQTSAPDTAQKKYFKNMGKHSLITSESSISNFSQTGGSEIDVQIIPLMKGGSMLPDSRANNFSESDIDIQIVPIMNGGQRSEAKGKSKTNYTLSESSPFITSEVFKQTLEQHIQTGGKSKAKNTTESEFDSNKLLNIIMQMGGEHNSSESHSEYKKSEHKKPEDDSDDDDEDDSDDEDLFEDEDDDDDEDEDEDEDKEDSSTQVSRTKKQKKQKSLPKRSFNRLRTPNSDSSNSSSSSDRSSSSSSSESSNPSSVSSSSDSSSDSDKYYSAYTSSISSFILPTTTKKLSITKNVSRSTGSIASSIESSDSVYIMSSDSSIGSRNINLLSFDEPVNNARDKKSKKSKSKKAKKY